MTDRAISTALGYVLGLAIVTAMVAGLFLVTGDVVETERERAIQSELRVLGNRLAADLTTVDRLALATPGSEARLDRELPNAVAGSSYRIRVAHGGTGPARIELSTSSPDVSVTVRVRNGTALANSTVGGGDLAVRYNGTAMVVRNV